ncbi:MAG: hypothetical protein JWQ72_1313, partial [Polaromonas sp.]|nr:hypothetical protein [Polaromonas sp.]
TVPSNGSDQLRSASPLKLNSVCKDLQTPPD